MPNTFSELTERDMRECLCAFSPEERAKERRKIEVWLGSPSAHQMDEETYWYVRLARKTLHVIDGLEADEAHGGPFQRKLWPAPTQTRLPF